MSPSSSDRFSTFARARRDRKIALMAIIKRMQPVDERKLMGIFSLQTGLKFRTITEYLNELEAAGLIDRKDGMISIPEGATE